VSKFFLRWQTS